MTGSAVDRLAVIETCTRMVWHADQRASDALHDVFADEVLLDDTNLQGGEPGQREGRMAVGAQCAIRGEATRKPHRRTPKLKSKIPRGERPGEEDREKGDDRRRDKGGRSTASRQASSLEAMVAGPPGLA